MTKPNNKLDHKKLGLFKIKRNIKNISYKFHFSPTIKIYLIFHIFLLKLTNPNTPTGPVSEIYLNL
jgi:hypothetical protein